MIRSFHYFKSYQLYTDYYPPFYKMPLLRLLGHWVSLLFIWKTRSLFWELCSRDRLGDKNTDLNLSDWQRFLDLDRSVAQSIDWHLHWPGDWICPRFAKSVGFNLGLLTIVIEVGIHTSIIFVDSCLFSVFGMPNTMMLRPISFFAASSSLEITGEPETFFTEDCTTSIYDLVMPVSTEFCSVVDSLCTRFSTYYFRFDCACILMMSVFQEFKSVKCFD